MSEALKLAAEARDRAGKGASRAIRREGRVPAVIYGNKKDPVQVHVEAKALVKLLSTGHFLNSVIEVEVGGKTERTLPRDVQFHPSSHLLASCGDGSSAVTLWDASTGARVQDLEASADRARPTSRAVSFTESHGGPGSPPPPAALGLGDGLSSVRFR